MKSTLVCVHVMPKEIELFETFMTQYKRALLYLEDTDKVTIKASLNLNPELTDWDGSELKPEYFISRFEKLFDGVPNINEIILDNKLMGTTQQKRESIALNYDQFIFVDADIAFPEQLLKYQLEASYLLKDKYILIPNITKLWDHTWDILVHDDFKDKPYGYYQQHDPIDTINQNIENVEVELSPTIKFGCGMHTLYSKEFGYQLVVEDLDFFTDEDEEDELGDFIDEGIDEDELLSFINEYYMIYPERLPEKDLY